VVAGILGFTGVASTTRTIAKVLFFIALAIFLIVLIFGVMLGMLVFWAWCGRRRGGQPTHGDLQPFAAPWRPRPKHAPARLKADLKMRSAVFRPD